MWLLGIGVLLSSVLWCFYRYTRFGLATSASAENPVATAALGWSPSLMMAMNWMIGGVLAGVAAILIDPISGLSPTIGTLTIIPDPAAGLLGGFSSFPLAFAGGLLVGVLESEGSFYFPTWTTTMPLLIIVILLVIRGGALPLRGYLTDRLPLVGRGRPRPAVIAVGIAVVLGSMVLFTPSWTRAITTSLIVAILCLSLVVITGYAGQISLAQYAMAGVGALFAGRLAAAEQVPFVVALIAGVAGAVLAGIVVGLPTLRVRGVNLAVVTLSLGVCIETIVLSNTRWTGGPITGTVVAPPHLFGWNIDSFYHPKSYAVVCLALFIASSFHVSNIRRGRTGRRLLAVRDNERAAASVGVSVFTAKLYAFGVAPGLAGLVRLTWIERGGQPLPVFEPRRVGR